MQEEKREVAPNRYPILNTYVNALSMDETVDYVKRVIARRTPPVQHVVINALKVNLMEKDPELREIVNSCPLINADGASILWAAKKLGVPVTERVTGIDLFMRLVEEAAKNGYKIYLFGAKPEVVEKVREYLEGLNIFEEILITRAGGVISSHCGPGTLGILFILGG